MESENGTRKMNYLQLYQGYYMLKVVPVCSAGTKAILLDFSISLNRILYFFYI